MAIKSSGGVLFLYVNGEPFNAAVAIHSAEDKLYIGSKNDLSYPINMTLKSGVI